MESPEIEKVRAFNSIFDRFEFAALRDALESSDPEALSSGFPGLDELVLGSLSPELVTEFHGEAVLQTEGRRYEGLDGFLLSFRRWFAAFDEYEIEHGNYEQIGDWVVYDVVHRGKGRGSGLPLEFAQSQRWRFENGRIAEIHVYASREEALEGLRPGASD